MSGSASTTGIPDSHTPSPRPSRPLHPTFVEWTPLPTGGCFSSLHPSAPAWTPPYPSHFSIKKTRKCAAVVQAEEMDHAWEDGQDGSTAFTYSLPSLPMSMGKWFAVRADPGSGSPLLHVVLSLQLLVRCGCRHTLLVFRLK